MDIKEVERVLRCTRFLPLPKHVIIIDEPVTEKFSHHVIRYAGLTPKWRRDTIILTSLADEETIIHETLHAGFGLGEVGATVLGKLLKWRAKFRVFPRLREFRYVEAESPHPKMKHYVLEAESRLPLGGRILRRLEVARREEEGEGGEKG